MPTLKGDIQCAGERTEDSSFTAAGKGIAGGRGHHLAQIPFRFYSSIHPPSFLLIGIRPPPPRLCLESRGTSHRNRSEPLLLGKKGGILE